MSSDPHTHPEQEPEKPLERTEGWVHIFNSRKWHYFRDSRALCGGWMYLGNVFDAEENITSPQNCAGCRKKREKELARVSSDAVPGEGR